MTQSNLSKTKPAFRTSGGVTGNFGAGKRKGGSALNDIPANKRESLGTFPSDAEYRDRMVASLPHAETPRLRQFIQAEIDRIDQKTGRSVTRENFTPQGAYCAVTGHFVGPHM